MANRDMITTDDPASWMTPTQLATRLGVKLGTVYSWRSAGTGPVAVRVGGRPRYREADVQAWLAARVEGGAR